MTNRYIRGKTHRAYFVQPHGYCPDVLHFLSHPSEPEPKLYYGVEFETEFPTKYKARSEKHLRRLAQFLKGREGIWFVENDCSIDGYELVSHPMSMRVWNENKELKSLCTYVKSAGFNNKSDKAGFHIHASREGLAHDVEEQNNIIGRIAYIIDKFYDCFMSIGQRKQNYYCYKPEADIDSYDTDDIAGLKAYHACADHYCAMNTEGTETIEFRFFSSTIDGDRVLGYVQLVDTLIHFSKEHTLAEIVKINDITRILESDKKELNKILDEFVNEKVNYI